MKVGTEDKKKLIIAGVAGFFAIFALYYLYSELFGGTTNPPQPTPAVVVTSSSTQTAGPNRSVSTPPGFVAGKGAAQQVGTTSGKLDPTLHMEAMLVTESLVYGGTGRNIFAGADTVAPVSSIPKPIAQARPSVPLPPPPVVNLGPPPPPPINLKFFGTSTSASGVRKAFLLNGDDVYLASAGDVVQRKYRVISIAPTTILIEDIPNNNKQSLPLIPN
jgi:hypothetical protein